MTISASFTIVDPSPLDSSRLFSVLNDCEIVTHTKPLKITRISIILDAPSANLSAFEQAQYRRAALSLFTYGEVVLGTASMPTIFKVSTFQDTEPENADFPTTATRLELHTSFILPPNQQVSATLSMQGSSAGGPLTFWTGSLEIETSERQETLNPEKETDTSVFPCETPDQRVLITST